MIILILHRVFLFRDSINEVYIVDIGLCLQIDSVGEPSWQAQISGTKTWTLVPPIECELVCVSFNVTVRRGDISKSMQVF